MKIMVLIKEVPDMEKVSFDSGSGRVDRSSASAEMNPLDEYALALAVKIKGELPEAKVHALTMGPPAAIETLRMAYAVGSDEIIMLSDTKFGGSDTYATARTLAKAMDLLGTYDLIICGEKSVDGDTAQVGAEVAAFMDIPYSYFVDSVNCVSHKEITVTMSNVQGMKQKRMMKLPALISVTKNVTALKLPTVDRILNKGKKKSVKIDFSSLSDMLEVTEVGIKGSPTKVSKIKIPKPEIMESLMFRGKPHEFLDYTVETLHKKGFSKKEDNND